MDLRDFSGSSDYWAQIPFTVVDKHGSVWNVATDKAWLVGVKTKARFNRCTGPSKAVFRILDILQAPTPDAAHEVKVTALLEWVGLNPTYGEILGASLDLTRLRTLLQAIPWKEVRLWNGAHLFSSGDPCLVLEAKGVWRALLMGVSELEGDVPSFDLGGDVDLFDLAEALDE